MFVITHSIVKTLSSVLLQCHAPSPATRLVNCEANSLAASVNGSWNPYWYVCAPIAKLVMTNNDSQDVGSAQKKNYQSSYEVACKYSSPQTLTSAKPHTTHRLPTPCCWSVPRCWFTLRTKTIPTATTNRKHPPTGSRMFCVQVHETNPKPYTQDPRGVLCSWTLRNRTFKLDKSLEFSMLSFTTTWEKHSLPRFSKQTSVALSNL